MSKCLSKLVNKVAILSIVLAVVVAAAVAVSCIFGVNFSKTVGNVNTVTVTGGFFQDSSLDEVEDVCRNSLEKAGKIAYVKNGGRMGADNELVFVFAEDVDVTEAVAALKTVLTAKCADVNDKVFYGTTVTVQPGNLKSAATIPVSYVVKAAVAVVVFAALAFLYVAVRYKLNMGLVAMAATLVGAVVTAAVVLLVRIPVTYAVVYVAAVAALLSAAMTMLFLNKARANGKLDMNAETLVEESCACKEVLALAAVLTVALVLVGAIATAAVRWFAVAAFVGVLVSTFVALVFAPALYLPMKKAEDKKAAETNKSGYVGAKKAEETEEETVTE